MTIKTKQITKDLLKELPDIKIGDVVKVHQKVPVSTKDKKGDKEKKERIQIFEGVVLAMKHGKDISGTFIVRKIISGIGVEKTYPLHSPNIDKIEIVSRSKVRRAKLYYLRERAGKKAKLKREDYLPGQKTLVEKAPKTPEPPKPEEKSKPIEKSVSAPDPKDEK